MDESVRQNLEKLRHHISDVRDQIKRLGESLQSLLAAHRTRLENDPSEAFQPYKKKALQALDSVSDAYAVVRDQPLKEFEEELGRVVSGDAQPITHAEEQSPPKKKPRRRRRGRNRDADSRPPAEPSGKD